MASVSIRHKHLRLSQTKLERVKSVLGTATETEALEGAMDLVLAEAEILKALRRVKGKARINEKHPVVFRKALKYASMASGKLEIRECRVEEINRKSDALYQLIKHLLNSGVRVDAVGFQAHLDVDRKSVV